MTTSEQQSDEGCVVPLLDTAPPPGQRVLETAARPDRPAPNLYRALANAPELLEAWVGLAWPLRAMSGVPRLERELGIYALALRRGAVYVQRHHRGMAARAGASEELLSAVAEGRTQAPGLTAGQRAVLRLAGEIADDGLASRAALADLEAAFGRAAMLQVLVTVAFYEAVCVVNRSLRVPDDTW
jgi:alkylhydroperoxidase family enzyme